MRTQMFVVASDLELERNEGRTDNSADVFLHALVCMESIVYLKRVYFLQRRCYVYFILPQPRWPVNVHASSITLEY